MKVCCINCKKIIIEDWENYDGRFTEKRIECPYCGCLMLNLEYEEK